MQYLHWVHIPLSKIATKKYQYRKFEVYTTLRHQVQRSLQLHLSAIADNNCMSESAISHSGQEQVSMYSKPSHQSNREHQI